jgi:hypothetical protein
MNKIEIYIKLKEAELEAKSTDKRLTHQEVFAELRARIAEKADRRIVQNRFAVKRYQQPSIRHATLR